jgi:tetratricopeptide (TPR) repeat protein
MSFDQLISSGLAASRTDDSEQAIRFFQQAGVAAPDVGLPQFLLGAEYAALGDMDQAEAAFANAVRLAPDFPLARYQLGLLQFSSGRAAVGLLTWQPLLELPESDPLPHFVNGFSALAQDQLAEALAFCEQGLQRNTSNPALSADIEKVMAGIRVAMARNDGETVTGSEPEVGEEDAVDASIHVFLANYQQNGPKH